MSTKKTKTESKPTTEDEVVRLRQMNENQQTTIRQLNEKCKALIISGEEMGKEIATLKKSNAGLRGLNGKLQKEVDRCKTLHRNADELIEVHIEANTKLNSLIEEKDKTITALESQVAKLNVKIKEQANRIEEMKEDLGAAQATIDRHNSLPWYKRIFK